MYQLAAAGVMGYGYGIMAERGVDLVLQSQYTGHAAGTPFAAVNGGVLVRNYYPGLALFNWTTGGLQPRSIVTQVLSAHLDVGSDTVLSGPAAATNEATDVYALALESAGGDNSAALSRRKVILVNKRSTPRQVDIAKALHGAASTAYVVDQTYTDQPSPRVEAVASGEAITLPAFATAVVVQTV